MEKNAITFVLLVLATQALAGGERDISNERQQLAPHHYEQQWGVDCASLIERAQTEPDASPLAQEARLCAQLYTVPGAPFERPCPDFLLLEQQLTQGQRPAPQPACESQ